MASGDSEKANRRHRWLRKGLKGTGLLIAILVLSVLSIHLYTHLATNARIYNAPADIPPRQVGLVLGTSPNPYLELRLDAAAELYHSGKIRKILVSGDNQAMNYNEPQYMREGLVSRGVEGEDIVLDYAGFRTLDSMLRARDVFGLTELTVISQRVHVQRALFIADAYGIGAIGYAAAYPADSRANFKLRLREVFARPKAFLDCYILGTQARFPGPRESIDWN